jgi:hypothetical protein
VSSCCSLRRASALNGRLLSSLTWSPIAGWLSTLHLRIGDLSSA